MLLRDLLIETLMTRFPQHGFQPGTLTGEVGQFPAAHPAVGEVRIEATGTEATVFVGDLTHGHFGGFDSALQTDQVARSIVAEVAEFFEALFADQVLLWSSADGRSGGWQVPFTGRMPNDLAPGAKTFVWSGPMPGSPHASSAG